MLNPIVEKARQWVGTTWRAGQSNKGVSCDCVGFICGVGRALGLTLELENYSQTPQGESLLNEFDKYCQRIDKEDVEPGDILIFKIDVLPSHVGIMAYDGYFIHADARKKIGKVVEVPLGHWSRVVVAAYRFPL